MPRTCLIHRSRFWIEAHPNHLRAGQRWAKSFSLFLSIKWGCYTHWDNLPERISSTVKHYANVSYIYLLICLLVSLYSISFHNEALHETTRSEITLYSHLNTGAEEIEFSAWQVFTEEDSACADLTFIKSFTQQALMKPLHWIKLSAVCKRE